MSDSIDQGFPNYSPQTGFGPDVDFIQLAKRSLKILIEAIKL